MGEHLRGVAAVLGLFQWIYVLPLVRKFRQTRPQLASAMRYTALTVVILNVAALALFFAVGVPVY